MIFKQRDVSEPGNDSERRPTHPAVTDRILLVEQNVNFALKICDYAYVLENGVCSLAGLAPSSRDPQLREAYLPKV